MGPIRVNVRSEYDNIGKRVDLIIGSDFAIDRLPDPIGWMRNSQIGNERKTKLYYITDLIWILNVDLRKKKLIG